MSKSSSKPRKGQRPQPPRTEPTLDAPALAEALAAREVREATGDPPRLSELIGTLAYAMGDLANAAMARFDASGEETSEDTPDTPDEQDASAVAP